MTEKKLKLKFENKESQKAFIEKYDELFSKPEVQEAAKNSKTPEEMLEILLKTNPDINADEVKEQLANMENQISDELSDKDLESVAGGLSNQEIKELIIVGVSTAAVIAGGICAYMYYDKYRNPNSKERVQARAAKDFNNIDKGNFLQNGAFLNESIISNDSFIY